MDGRVIYDYQIQQLEGRILTFVESLGLSPSQEKAAKDIFRDVFYQAMYFQLKYVWGPELQEAIQKSRARKEPPGSGHTNH
jgi:hypothetical protein